MSSISGVLVDNSFSLQGKNGTVLLSPLCVSSGVDLLQNEQISSATDIENIHVPQAGVYLVTLQVNNKGIGSSASDVYGLDITTYGKLPNESEVLINEFSTTDNTSKNTGGSNYEAFDCVTVYDLVQFTAPGNLYLRVEPAFYNTASRNDVVAGTCITMTKVNLVTGSPVVV